jgi:hypothetical protein
MRAPFSHETELFEQVALHIETIKSSHAPYQIDGIQDLAVMPSRTKTAIFGHPTQFPAYLSGDFNAFCVA